MKRIILITVALLGAAAAWLTPVASATSAPARHDVPTAAGVLTCPPLTRCDDTSWGG
ncbi:hypothetical protein OG535_02595 [Kitasatospora sp. NBC_00085]|uniref:hypothetical protein n=1 Tax=unclassified Kitasatospora TaxID=2633591 RepID=UPI002F907F26